jgi:uncharacterized membrane protein
MDRELYIYAIYTLFFALLAGTIIAVPLLSFSQDMDAFYKAFAPTCHQKLSRSLCVLSDGRGYWVGDCTPQNGQFVPNAADRETVKVAYPPESALNPGTSTITGYKMPVCSRDFGIYGAMFFGALVYPLIRDVKEKRVWPAIWLILALVPIALDGGVQFLSDLGLLPAYESTNAVRLFTGALAGFAASLYAIPILMNMFGADAKETKAEKTATGKESAQNAAEKPGTQ